MITTPIDALRDIVGRFPTTRDEDWKYTDLARARDISSRWLDEGGTRPSETPDIADIVGDTDADWFVIANGRLADIPIVDGVSVEKINELPAGDNALAEFNAALLDSGLRLRIEGRPGKPVGLLFIDEAGSPSVSQGFVEVAFEPGSRGEVFEYHASRGTGEHYSNTILCIDIGDDAVAHHVRLQDRALDHVQTHRTTVSVGRDAHFESASFDLGGGLVRNDVAIDIAQPGATVNFAGLYLAGDGQHVDNHTRVDHRVGPATSRQEYRGILNGKCRCVWNGKAIVHEGADGTDADQANHNLLLSAHAEIDAKPELEIYTDDVKCSHGTTVGQLDETALFYLRTRGLDPQRATEVLTHAFAAGLVSRIPVEAAQEPVSRLMERRLGELIRSEEDYTA
ncbi:MAG: Fe-S cluster assembly protein SufD [Woeseiaceae bacterium]|nr:Fe-S cluster assembly protein SufD [Woeseiaceae bacterium]